MSQTMNDFLGSLPLDELRRLKAELRIEIEASKQRQADLEFELGRVNTALVLRARKKPRSNPEEKP